MPPAMPPTIAPVLLLLPPELGPTDGVMRTVDWMVVVTIWPLAPVELLLCESEACDGNVKNVAHVH
jgi:hypothetical protein